MSFAFKVDVCQKLFTSAGGKITGRCEKRPGSWPDVRMHACKQALEAAIEAGLPRVEAGAQGEHKLQRGYLPSRTYSSHYVRDGMLRTAVDRFLHHERAQIDYTMEALMQHVSPYKDTPAA